MKLQDAAAAVPRLRQAPRPAQRRQVDAQIAVPPRLLTLILLTLAVALLQGTLLQHVSLRGARLSAMTVLVVWTGLRCGVATGGFIGLLGGLLEDASGGSGNNVLGTTLAGAAAGTLANRFFFDSIPVSIGTVAAASALRAYTNYIILESAFGYRGLFARTSDALLWQIVLNCSSALLLMLYLRLRAHKWPSVSA